MKGRMFLVASAILIVSGYIQAQTPGQIPVFDQPGTGACNNAGGNDCIDSVITQAGGNIGIGTTRPTAKLDVMGGNVSLENSTATSGNILKGGFRFLHNYGDFNTFLGSGAGNFTMTGTDNTAIGYQALPSNASGGFNTAVGLGALYSNTTGNFNTASGVSALQSNTDGNWNTAIGYQALFNNTTGFENTAIGLSALGVNTTGSYNTASAYQALYYNTTGYENTASGNQALYYNTTGYDNTASGVSALYSNTTGAANTASGSYALFFNTAGNFNTASGYSALSNNSTGYFNTASGFYALSNNSTGNNNTAIGRGADVSQGDLSNATAIGYNAIVNASNKIRLGNTGVTVIEGQVPYTFPSDRNQKENFQPVDGEEVLRKIGALSLTSWNYIGHDPKQFRYYGPVAQEFFAAFGHDSVGTIGTDTTINSGDMEGILMIAVQALGKQNAELKTRIEALERVIRSQQEKAGQSTK